MLTPIEIDMIANAVVEKLRSSPAVSAELDVHGVAELLGCSVPTVERMVRERQIPSYKVQRLRRFNRDEVLNALRNRVPY